MGSVTPSAPLNAFRRATFYALFASMAFSAEPALAQPFRMQASPPAVPSVEAQRAFQSSIDAQARLLASDDRLKSLSQGERQALVEFVAGNLLIAAVHQLGLALMSELSLPALGGADHGADDFAVLAMLELGKTHFSDRVLVEAAKGWFTSLSRKKTASDAAGYERAMNVRRGQRIVCLMLGADAVRFKALAEDTILPRKQQRNCGWDYDRVVRAWDIVLRPHRPRVDQLKTHIDVAYGVAADNLKLYARIFRNLEFLQTIADVAASQIAWRAPLLLEMRGCGAAASTWTSSSRTLSICYEMAEEFAELYLEQKPR